MQDVFIVGYKRTPIGSFLGALSSVPATELGSIALKAALAHANLPADRVQEVYVGNVLSANLGQAPASQVALGAGLPDTIPTTLVNKVCASGTKAMMLGAQTIRLGEADVIAVVGTENMSAVPFYAPTGRLGNKYGNVELLDGIVRDGLQDVYDKFMMGHAGDETAKQYGFSREDQDQFAINSYKRAEASRAKLAKEITPVTLKTRKGEAVVDLDEEPGKVIYDKIPTLRPAFNKDGTVTAANAPGLNDGAAALILASEKAVKALGLTPLARVAGWGDAQRKPIEFTVAPSDALPIALQRAGVNKNDLAVVEINEAFSVVALANAKILELDLEKVNPTGGAVALGHPLGASGARIIGSALTQLHETGGQYAGIGICNGGGGASAVVLERV